MSTLGHDVRYAIRVFCRTPVVTTVVLATLALGIGLNTAIFSIVDAVLLKPLPYHNADRIVGIWARRPTGQPSPMSTLNYLDYAHQSTSFERLAATTGCCGSTMLAGDPPMSLWVTRVQPEYFDVFGATAAFGRTFAPGDDEPGRNHVVVLSHTLWASRFGSDTSLVGRTIRLNAEPYTVIGVLPAASPFSRSFVQAWLPLTFSPDTMNRDAPWLTTLTGGAIGLLKPGVTLDRARAELDTISARLSAEYPETNKGWSTIVRPYRTIIVRTELQRSLVLLLAAVAIVLLIACVNVANVMLARALAREREVAVRLALGASHGRLIRQFLTESLAISSLGGVLGILVGYATIAFLKATLAALPVNLATIAVLVPAEASIRLDWRVLMFSTVLSVGCGIGFGLAPALGMLRGTRSAVLGSDGRAGSTIRHRRLRGALIVAEVALAFILLANAGLLMRSILNMRQADTGFDATNVITAEMPVPEHRFADAGQFRTFMHQVVDSVRSVPGVIDAAFSNGLPMEGAPSGVFFQIAGRPPVQAAERPFAEVRLVSPGYFRVLGLRVRQGRHLNDGDRADAPLAAVVNETMARMYFPNEGPVGQRLLMDAPGFGTESSGELSPYEIVGVIADERLTPFDDTRQHPAVYVSVEQNPREFVGLLVRTSLEPERLERSLRDAIARVDKDQAVENVKTVEQLKSESMIPDRLRFVLLGVFAAIAVALSAIGIYGVISHAVVQRSREMGIRAALGASPARLVRLILGGGLTLTAIGLAIGCAGALGVARLLGSFLFGVNFTDPMTLVATAIVLAGVAGAASYVPARRNTTINPRDALRAE